MKDEMLTTRNLERAVAVTKQMIEERSGRIMAETKNGYYGNANFGSGYIAGMQQALVNFCGAFGRINLAYDTCDVCGHPIHDGQACEVVVDPDGELCCCDAGVDYEPEEIVDYGNYDDPPPISNSAGDWCPEWQQR